MGFEFYEERDFKDTELGPLPVDWEVVRLGEVGQIITGNTPSKKVAEYWENGTIDFIKPPDLKNGLVNTATERISKRALEVARILEGESILVSCIGIIGKVGYATKLLAFNQQINAVVPNDKIYGMYLFYALQHENIQEVLNSMKSITTVPIVSKSKFKTLPIPLPPLEEQKAIAEVLRSVQLAIEKTEEVIRATKELKKSMMKHLFTYGYVPIDETDKVKLKETEIGLIPEHWEVVRLGEVAEIKYGKAKPKDNGTIPVIGSGGIYDWTNSALVNFPTVVVGRKGTAGQVWLIEQPCWPSDTTYYLVWKHVVDIRFVFEFLNLNPLSGKHAKTTLPSLQRPDLENYLIPLPPLEEQKAIAEVLRAIDEKLQKEEEYKKALQNLFKSLLHHLMSGKIRVRRKTN